MWAAKIDIVWVVERIANFINLADPAKRVWSFFIQSVATFAVLLRSLGRTVHLWGLTRHMSRRLL